jgi:hypothetical protein
MIAIGRKRAALEQRLGQGSASYVALHPASLERITRLGALCYAGNSRSFEQLVGLPLVADHTLPQGLVDVRPADAIADSPPRELPGPRELRADR